MKTYQQHKENARQKAIQLQSKLSTDSLSYGELNDINNYFYKIGRKYGLIREFQANGLI